MEAPSTTPGLRPNVANTIAQVKPGAHDLVDSKILVVYARHCPQYAIYSTKDRLSIQYADDDDRQVVQRRLTAALNAPRGEINGLIDGWRGNQDLRRAAAARRYDRRVADAMTIALEGDVESAGLLLAATKQDIIDERTGHARIQYLLVACMVFAVCVVAICAASTPWFARQVAMPGYAQPILLAAGAGTVGAFFSIAIAMRTRTVLTDFHFWNNAADAALRLVIGLIAAGILICLVKTGAVSILVGAAQTEKIADLNGIIIGFLAGFSERLLPDLLARVANNATVNTADPAAAPKPPVAPLAHMQARMTAFAPDPQEDAGADDGKGADLTVQPGEETEDAELPPTYGGVAAQR